MPFIGYNTQLRLCVHPFIYVSRKKNMEGGKGAGNLVLRLLGLDTAFSDDFGSFFIASTGIFLQFLGKRESKAEVGERRTMIIKAALQEKSTHRIRNPICFICFHVILAKYVLHISTLVSPAPKQTHRRWMMTHGSFRRVTSVSAVVRGVLGYQHHR